MDGDVIYEANINGQRVEYQQIQGTDKWEATAYDEYGNQARSNWTPNIEENINLAVNMLEAGYYWRDDAAEIKFDRDVVNRSSSNYYNNQDYLNTDDGLTPEPKRQVVQYYEDGEKIPFSLGRLIVAILIVGAVIFLTFPVIIAMLFPPV